MDITKNINEWGSLYYILENGNTLAKYYVCVCDFAWILKKECNTFETCGLKHPLRFVWI